MKITIARECGCYGDEVGQVLADRLNVPLYNKKTLTELAKKKGILEHYPDYFGENPAGTLLAVIAEDDGEDSVVHRTPRKVLDELIGETSCILIGRAGNYAYRKENDVVRVFLSGDRESRIHHLMEKHKVKRHEAETGVSSIICIIPGRTGGTLQIMIFALMIRVLELKVRQISLCSM